MPAEPRVLGLITARGGSKGIPGKNIRPLAGKPMIAWTIEAALRSRSITRLILSSDDPEIIEVAKAWGCDVPFVRPAELSGDTASSMDVVHHAMDAVGQDYDYLVLLQPTSPLRLPEDIDGCVRECVAGGAKSCIAIGPSAHSTSVLVTRDAAGHIRRLLDLPSGITQRQQAAQCHAINGAVYVARWEWLRGARSFLSDEAIGYEMPRERSIDIDERLDMEIAEFLLSRRPQERIGAAE